MQIKINALQLRKYLFLNTVIVVMGVMLSVLSMLMLKNMPSQFSSFVSSANLYLSAIAIVFLGCLLYIWGKPLICFCEAANGNFRLMPVQFFESVEDFHRAVEENNPKVDAYLKIAAGAAVKKSNSLVGLCVAALASGMIFLGLSSLFLTGNKDLYFTGNAFAALELLLRHQCQKIESLSVQLFH